MLRLICLSLVLVLSCLVLDCSGGSSGFREFWHGKPKTCKLLAGYEHGVNFDCCPRPVDIPYQNRGAAGCEEGCIAISTCKLFEYMEFAGGQSCMIWDDSSKPFGKAHKQPSAGLDFTVKTCD